MAASGGRVERLGVVAGGALDPWDLQVFTSLRTLGFPATILGSVEREDGVSTESIATARDINMWRRIRLLERIGFKIHGFGWKRGLGYVPSPFAVDDAVVGLRALVREFDVLVAFETYRASAYQSCRSHPAVVVKVTENIPFNPHPWPYPWIRRSVRRLARRFVCVTESAKRALLTEGFDADRIRVIPEAVNTEVFRPSAPPPEEAGGFTVGYAAKMDPAHGFRQLLTAFARLSESFDARLRIAGEGGFALGLASMTQELGIDPRRVEYLGKIPYSQMPGFMRSVDVLCVPCQPVAGWRPQFGIVNIEAMACGKPVVATNLGATSEVLPPGLQQFLVPPGGIEALARALSTLASDSKLRAQLGQEGREWTREHYDTRHVASQWASVLSEAVEEVRGRQAWGG